LIWINMKLGAAPPAIAPDADKLYSADIGSPRDGVLVKAQLVVFVVLACSLAGAERAAAQADVLTARKIACTPESMTRCTAPGKCNTEPASAQDKREILIIDFAAKTATSRKGDQLKQFGRVVDDQVSGDVRRFAIADLDTARRRENLAASLTKGGKLALAIPGPGSKAEATCVSE
jgi:hypothetical protein